MKLAIVGGITRSAESYRRLVGDLGHSLELHDGLVGGRGSDGLRRVISRADLVVVVTDVNSHGAVAIAKREARDAGKPTLVLRRCGLAKLRELIAQLG